MATQENQASSWLDTVIIWVAVAILVVCIAGYYYFDNRVSALVRALGLLAGVGVAVVVALQSQVGRTAWSYVQGSRTEVRRVVWPTRQDTVRTTGLVLLVTLILATFIWVLDVFLGWGVALLTARMTGQL